MPGRAVIAVGARGRDVEHPAKDGGHGARLIGREREGGRASQQKPKDSGKSPPAPPFGWPT